MLYNIQFRADAIQDIDAAIDWYELKKEGLGISFWATVKAETLRIQETPLIYAVIFEKEQVKIRRAIVKKFHYSLYYEIIGNTIWILSVMHDSRHPDKWQRRV